MKYAQFFVMEIGKGCNLAEKHKKCPSGHPGRWENVLTDNTLDLTTMTGIAIEAREFGFRGNIAFHYYNEPTLNWDRLIKAVVSIKTHIPEQKFTLWTNGTLLQPTNELREFDQIWVSNYLGADFRWLNDYVDRVTILGGGLDNRLTTLDEPNEDAVCFRPFNELIIDYHGNGRLCCMDWRGQCELGNVFTDGFSLVVEMYQAMRGAVADKYAMKPVVCQYCVSRQGHIAGLVPEVQFFTMEDRPWEK